MNCNFDCILFNDHEKSLFCYIDKCYKAFLFKIPIPTTYFQVVPVKTNFASYLWTCFSGCYIIFFQILLSTVLDVNSLKNQSKQYKTYCFSEFSFNDTPRLIVTNTLMNAQVGQILILIKLAQLSRDSTTCSKYLRPYD